MGAVKEAAIMLEQRQAEAVELGDAGLAYRLGLYEACRLIHEWQQHYLDTGAEAEPLTVLYAAWRDIFDSASYLGDNAYR